MLRSGSAVQLVVLVALGALLQVKARFEERALTNAYPQYAGYAATTGRFLPGRPGWPGRPRRP